MSEPHPSAGQQHRHRRWLRPVRHLGRFLWRLVVRFQEDSCPQMAASLSYATLLALVPLLAIGLALLTAFPAFDEAQAQLKSLIFEALPPEQALDASEQLDALLANVSKLTGPGVLALAVTAILLLSNVHASLNAIWRVREPRPLALQLLVFWALLTLGPLLLGASISISSIAIEPLQAQLGLGEAPRIFSRLLSVLVAALAFAVMFLVVPNRPVSMSAALLGGGVAALGFELLKFGFGLYITSFPSYQIVYGALAALPILLIWVYLVWTVILFGAEVAATLPEWRAAYRRGFERCGPLDRLPLALALLSRLQDAQQNGTPLRRSLLTADLPMPPAEVDLVLERLRHHRFIATTAGARWVLARNLARANLGDLLRALDLTLEQARHWPEPVPAMLDAFHEGFVAPLDLPLDRVLRSGQGAARPLSEEPPAQGVDEAAQVRSLHSKP